MARGGTYTHGQLHHVIPKELGDFLFQEFSVEWDDTFSGKTVLMAQVGSHARYTGRIKDILMGNMGSSKATLIQFADNLIREIETNYVGYQPDDIPVPALQNQFPGAAPTTSSKGRLIKPKSWM